LHFIEQKCKDGDINFIKLLSFIKEHPVFDLDTIKLIINSTKEYYDIMNALYEFYAIKKPSKQLS
jgi:hypothetical protein